MNVAKLENWSLHNCPASEYFAPEQIRKKLAGEVYGHWKYPDGYKVVTSVVVECNGNKVTTASGNIYVLGKPSADYADWVKKECGYEIDPDNPLKGI